MSDAVDGSDAVDSSDAVGACKAFDTSNAVGRRDAVVSRRSGGGVCSSSLGAVQWWKAQSQAVVGSPRRRGSWHPTQRQNGPSPSCTPSPASSSPPSAVSPPHASERSPPVAARPQSARVRLRQTRRRAWRRFVAQPSVPSSLTSGCPTSAPICSQTHGGAEWASVEWAAGWQSLCSSSKGEGACMSTHMVFWKDGTPYGVRPSGPRLYDGRHTVGTAFDPGMGRRARAKETDTVSILLFDNQVSIGASLSMPHTYCR